MILDTAKVDDYDIIGGIRGMDFPHEDGAMLIKDITTGVIRDFVGIDGRLHNVVCHSAAMAKEIWERSYEDERRDARVLWNHGGHFQDHIIVAFKGLMAKDVEGAYEYFQWLIDELDSR